MAAALSVAGAVFLILELDQPLGGMIRISSDPMRRAHRALAMKPPAIPRWCSSRSACCSSLRHSWKTCRMVTLIEVVLLTGVMVSGGGGGWFAPVDDHRGGLLIPALLGSGSIISTRKCCTRRSSSWRACSSSCSSSRGCCAIHRCAHRGYEFDVLCAAGVSDFCCWG